MLKGFVSARKDFDLSSVYNKDFMIGAAVALTEQRHTQAAFFWDYA
jgi:hypothetical protein